VFGNASFLDLLIITLVTSVVKCNKGNIVITQKRQRLSISSESPCLIGLPNTNMYKYQFVVRLLFLNQLLTFQRPPTNPD